MRLPKFDYFEPATLADARALLTEHRDRAAVVAGGTDLLPQMKQRRLRPAVLVNLKEVPGLAGIVAGEAGLQIGAMTLLREVAESEPVRARYTALAEAAGRVASREIRNLGTLGGNVCLDNRCWYINHGDFWLSSKAPCFKRDGDVCYVIKGADSCYATASSDTAPALIALGAELEIAGADGSRVLPVADFFTGDGVTPNRLQSGEILTAIHLPALPERAGSAFQKYAARASIDFSVGDAAAFIQLGPEGTVAEARLVVSAVSPAPLRLSAGEEALRGARPDAAAIARAAEAAIKQLKPISNSTTVGAPAAWRRRLLQSLIARALADAAARASA